MTTSARIIESGGRRYLMGEALAAGGMASVHVGVQLGVAGFSRVVALKQLLGHLARDQEFVTMFLDEARTAARVQHPNVVSTLDVIQEPDQVLLVMEYVAGASLSGVLRRARMQRQPVPIDIVLAIGRDACRGLEAAHAATGRKGEPLELVHRDVSPQNVLIGTDGVTRLADFGIAKARGRAHVTRDESLKGKVAYMAPELLRGEPATVRSDVFALGVVLWEALAGRRLFAGRNEAETLGNILAGVIPALSTLRTDVPAELEATLRRTLDPIPELRSASAGEVGRALERAATPAGLTQVQEWLTSFVSDELEDRSQLVARTRAQAQGEGEVRLAAETRGVRGASVPIDAPLAPARRTPGWGLGVAAVACVLLVGWALAQVLSPRAPSSASASAVQASAPAVDAQVTPAVTSSEAVAPAPSAPAPSATSELALRPPIRETKSKLPPSRPNLGKPAVPFSGRDPRCYSVDAKGNWVIKPACL